MQLPETNFAKVGNDRVAYQVFGDGPRDLVHTIGLWSEVDVIFEDPSTLPYLKRLASFSRVILFDCRGSGISDPRPTDGRSIAEHWSEDLLAVLDAIGARTPTLLGMTDAGPLLLHFVGTHPERCGQLILFNTSASFSAAPDYPAGADAAFLAQFEEFLRAHWATETWQDFFLPSLSRNVPLRRWICRWCRTQASPAKAVANFRDVITVDSRRFLSAIRVPTLVLSRPTNRLVPAPQIRYVADHVRGARFVELPGTDGLPMWEHTDRFVDLVEEFVTGTRRGGGAQRELATILFTDIVDSTRQAATLGDARWRQLLERHDRTVREHATLHGGRLVETTGDGTLLTFANPDRAVDCALGLQRALPELGIRIRAGLHTGTLELREDGRIGGLAVHIGARVLAAATADEVLASRTVHDVLIGSRYGFIERGEHELKGVPGRWPLYAIELSEPAALLAARSA